jgi:tight adherence protein C
MTSTLALVTACSAAGAAAALVTARHRRPSRLAELGLGGAPVTDSDRCDTLARLGAPVRRRLGVGADPAADRLVGLALVGAVVLLVVVPPLALIWCVGLGVVSVLRRRRARRRDRDAVVDELPEVVDLLWLATTAGLTVPLAVRVVERHGTGQVARALGRARRRAALGPALADALDEVPVHLGDTVRPVTRVLAGALRDGTSVAEPLERVAAEVRTARRRATEERARRGSVRLLFPLVVCILPAFAVLTVVPLLAGALSGIAG